MRCKHTDEPAAQRKLGAQLTFSGDLSKCFRSSAAQGCTGLPGRVWASHPYPGLLTEAIGESARGGSAELGLGFEALLYK